MHQFFFRFALVGCLLTISTQTTGCGKTNSAAAAPAATQRQPVEVVNVVRRDMTEMLNIVGSLAANESATIRPEISGLVRAIPFDEGQLVKRGQLLAKIEDAELRAQVAQSEARFELAKLNLQRAENLRQTQANTQADMDRTHSEYATAQADLELLKVRLDRTEIKAPFDGVVGARTLSPGDYVNPQSTVTTIDDLSRLKIDFPVPERFAEKVRNGTVFKVRSQSQAAGAIVAGEVYFVSSVIDRATRSSQVKGFVTGDTAGLRSGMFVNVDLVLEVRRGVLTVPEGAILVTPSGSQVVAVKEVGTEKVAEFIPVRTGLRFGNYVEVTPLKVPLTDDRQVVAAGVGALVLFPGAKLELKPFHEDYRTP